MPQMPPSRRSVLTGFGSLAATAGLGSAASGCAAPSAAGAGRTRLRFWHLYGGGDGVTMQAMLDAFRAGHPGVGLESATLQWGPAYYTKLGMAGAGGRAPEVAALHLSRLPGFAPGRLLDPFDLDLLARHGVRPEHFPEAIWRRGASGGAQYAIPFDTHPFVLFYNTEVCAKAGLLDGNSPGKREEDGEKGQGKRGAKGRSGGKARLRPLAGVGEFTRALRAAREATGHPGLVIETLGNDTVGPWRLFATFYAQAGGTVLDPTATRVTLDDAKALRVLEWMRSLVEDGHAPRRVDYTGAVSRFNNGDSAFLITGEWEVSTYLTTELPFSMTRIPNLFGRPSAFADCHTFVLPHQADRGGASNEAAHRFVAWMLRHSTDWAAGGHVPAYRPVLSEPAYLELHPQSEYRSVVDDVALDPPAWFAGSASAMQIELGAALSGVLTGSRSPRDGLDEVRKRLRDLLATPDPFGGRA
ncbi:extracellular solute-binding protein [Streptomyces zingiberis]|uniref:Extracellular solute-binding protein n=1 Tax=Streptomyces zingiberis TaxID=2053010 RepID=A0ABX1BP84_9ACTN|nr:extracellular solute-binding protein [Streptomyces zingiberis]NJP99519.1 extracellular solute-binding protein [Streptomyces zingiberis]